MAFAALATDIVHDLAQNMREQAVVPLACRGVEGAVQLVLVHCLRVDDIWHALNVVEPV